MASTLDECRVVVQDPSMIRMGELLMQPALRRHAARQGRHMIRNEWQRGRDGLVRNRRLRSCLLAAALMLMTAPSFAEDTLIDTEGGPIKVETVAGGLDHPWGLAFLPDGRMLVTERPGRLRIVTPDGSTSEPLTGVPQVFAKGQGGLFDVALDPAFASNRLVYLAYAEPGDGWRRYGGGARQARRCRP